jgi:hypothetical protein
VLSAFGDDSADEKRQRVFTIAGVIGRREDWESLAALWVDRLDGRVFHGKDVESDRGEFAGTSHEDNLKLYADLATLLSGSRLFGYAHAIDLVAQREVFGDELLWDSPFYFCFTRVLGDCARNGYLSFPQDQVEFTFDARKESEYNTTQLYRLAREMDDWKFSDFLADTVSFATRSNVGIQVADLLARESMKALDRHVGQSRPCSG